MAKKYKITIEYGYDNYFPTEEHILWEGERLHIPQVVTFSQDGYMYYAQSYNIDKIEEGDFTCGHNRVTGLGCNIKIEEIDSIIKCIGNHCKYYDYDEEDCLNLCLGRNSYDIINDSICILEDSIRQKEEYLKLDKELLEELRKSQNENE